LARSTPPPRPLRRRPHLPHRAPCPDSQPLHSGRAVQWHPRRPLWGTLQKTGLGFEQMNAALKARAERRYENRKGRPCGRPFRTTCGSQLLRLRTDLLEERQRVEVVAAVLDLVALEGEDHGGGRLLTLARGRDRPF